MRISFTFYATCYKSSGKEGKGDNYSGQERRKEERREGKMTLPRRERKVILHGERRSQRAVEQTFF